MNLKKLDGTFNITINSMPYNTIDGDIYFNDTVALFKSNPELFEIETLKVKTLEELKAEKIAELKVKRDIYKKTVIIKEDITLFDLQIATNNYENMKALKYGWTQSDLDLFDSEMDNIVIKYNTIKDLINNSTLDTINSLLINFED